ncbi:MAG: ABC transporter ATP-binding protein [Candidatus Brocadiia bacterium]
MALIWRLIRTELGKRWKALLFVVLAAAFASATPYGFAMLGRWLVDDVLMVARKAPAPAQPLPQDEPAEPREPAVAGAEPAELEGIEEAALPQQQPPEPVPTRSAEEKLRLLAIFFLVSIGVHVAVTGLSGLSEFVKARINNAVILDLRTAVQQKLASMDLATFSREQVGQLMTRVLDDVSAIPGNLTQLVVNAITQVGMLVLGLVLLLRLNPTMALVVLCVLPFYGAACWVFLPRIKRNTEELRDRVAGLNGHVVERLSNVTTIKNYAQEGREVRDFGKRLEHNLGLSRRQQRLSLFFNSITTVVTGLGTLCVLALGFLNLKAGRMQLGEVLAFHGVTAQLFVPISALVGLAPAAQTVQVLAGRVFGILDTSRTIRTPDEPVEMDEMRGEVTFEEVSLRYQEGGPFAVRNINLHIPAGATAALVGPVGCGKSTLLLLLTRLYDPTDGIVRIDGVDIRRFRVRRLRRAVGNVLHDCPVFSGTIAENIAYGRPDASEDEIEEAARAVGLHDFVAEQSQGYQTPLGRGGITLEAEELARLGFARALFTRPAILTIDDTFASIEESAEQPLRAAVRQVHGNRTIVMATSRLSLCEDADMVVVMRQGRIEEQGTFEELMGRPGLFRRMYSRQMGIDPRQWTAGGSQNGAST